MPAAPMRRGVTELDLQGALRPYAMSDGLFQSAVALEIPFLLGMRQGRAYQPSMALPGRSVVALSGGGSELRATSVRLPHLEEGVLRTDQAMAFPCHHAPSRPPLVDLRLAPRRVYNAWWGVARTARPPRARRWWRGAVVGQQCSDLRRELRTGENRGTTIGAGLPSRQTCGGLRCAALMAAGTQDAPAAGERPRAPPPPIAALRRILWWTGRLLFLTKGQRAALWTWVRWRGRRSAARTVAACRPATSSQERRR